MPEAILSAWNVTYRAGEVPLVSDVDFEAAKGEFVAVIGPNGAGKSTLLRLLAGDTLPDEGKVTIGGSSTADIPAGELAFYRSVLADYVPVEIPFTARSVVEMGRFPHRRDPDNLQEHDREAVADAMERTDTTLLGGRVFSTLSSGERARVFLARVLAQDAPIVLLDEPTAALDVGHRELILREAASLARRGRSVVSVLHDLNSAAFYADRVVVMADGGIPAQGEPREVITEHLLSNIYDQAMRVMDHPYRDCPLVLVADDPPDGSVSS